MHEYGNNTEGVGYNIRFIVDWMFGLPSPKSIIEKVPVPEGIKPGTMKYDLYYKSAYVEFHNEDVALAYGRFYGDAGPYAGTTPNTNSLIHQRLRQYLKDVAVALYVHYC